MDQLSQDRKDEGGRTPSGGDDKELRKSPGDDGEGTRQPYNCTFCKRGFPTAQALGGHMNVHRKDRGRATPAVATEAARSTCSYETLVAFTGYGQTHPASGSEASTAAGGSLLHAERAPRELRLFGRDCAGRGKEGGGARDRREYCGKDDDGDHDEGEEELDLELRLGGAGS